MKSNSSRARRGRLGVVLSVAAVGLGVALYMGAFGAPSAPAAPAGASAAPVPVSLATVRTQDMPVWSEAVGTVTSLNVVNVRARIDGQLERVLFTEGQRVRQGDLLAVIDPRTFQAQVRQAQAQVAQEQAKLASLRVDLTRATELATAGAGPTQTVDSLSAQVRTEAAALQAAQATLESALLQLSFTRVVAPMDGRMGQRLVPAGSLVHASDTSGITTVTQMRPMWVSFQVPQDTLDLLMDHGQTRQLKVQAFTRDRSRPLAQGALEFVDSQVTAATGQIVLKARFDNADGALWPGQLVAVRMLLKTDAAAVVVPDAALQQGPSGSFVYVVDDAQKAQARPVVTGALWQGQRQIRSGLKTDERVVTQGQYRVAPGVAVTSALAGDGSTSAQVAAGEQGS